MGDGVPARREVAATGPQPALAPTAVGPSGPQQSGPPAVQPPGAAPPPASMVQTTHPHPRRPTASRSRFALVNWRVRWRLAAIIAVPTLTAAVLGALTINNDVNNWEATGRVQHLAQLNNDVVSFSQKLEDELNVSAAYAATRPNNADTVTSLKKAQDATDVAARSVIADSAAVTTGAGYQPGTVQDLNAVQAAINDLSNVRKGVTNSKFPASQIVRVFSGNLISPANTFSAAIGNGANDAELQGNVTTLGALVRNENQVAVQRAILYAALVSPAGTLRSEDLATLQQAHEQATADLADFNASTDTAEQQKYSNTVSGAQVDVAASNEILAETLVGSQPAVVLRNHGVNAEQWNRDMSLTLTDTRSVANDLATRINSRANTLRSGATTDLLVTGLVTLLLLALVVMVSTIVARSLIRPLRKLRTDALDVAGHRLPEMVRRLSQSEGADEGVEIEPIGVTSTDEIGEVARAFDQVHREAVRLAADEAMLRGNLNAMFINLSRRSQSLIERQLSLIDSLEQSEQDSGRLSSLFRLDHLATRMRRNSENLLVLAGHEVTRRWSQPVPLVDVLRAAISEIEQYERVVLNVQPGIVVVGQAVNDAVHLVAEIVENATTFSPEDTQVYVSGQPLSSGGVLLDITDNGVGISDQEMSHANWRLDNPPVVDVAVSRRMGLFVVGRLAARHGVRVRLRHAQAGGLTALIWLPDTVAAPEVAPPLGRLRRFEPDDYGPAASLSAPTATAPAPGSSAASQATAAARIPRFSPTNPGTPGAPASPSFTPAANAGPPAAPPVPGPAPAGLGAAGNGDGIPGSGIPGQAAPPQGGTPAGNNWEPAGNGWDLGSSGGDHDGPPTQALPVRNGNGTSNGKPASEAAEPWTTAGPSRMPAFGAPGSTGPGAPSMPPAQAPQFPIGSQNVHGSDGPSAADAANGVGSVATSGPGRGDANDVHVTVPVGGPDPRLPIFDSLESDWFRRSGQTLTAPQHGGQGPQAQAAAPQAANSSWTSPADEGWRAAQAVASPAAGDTTQAGLPKRVPRANLVPGSVGGSGGPSSHEAEVEAPARSADAARSRMASFQRGVRDGRAAAPQNEEP